jgi:phosphoenolpyruvate carboxylase
MLYDLQKELAFLKQSRLETLEHLKMAATFTNVAVDDVSILKEYLARVDEQIRKLEVEIDEALR